jgi:ring-1,2-phenylacetyl-CoA epoxidase subunit PaaB
MTSLDPRIDRLLAVSQRGTLPPIPPLDQFATYEVFVQPKEGKPFQHEGIVHAPNLEMAYVLAKETFTRRFTCVSLYVAETSKIAVSPITEGLINAYDLIAKDTASTGTLEFEIYQLPRRGKQHVHAGSVKASSADHALSVAAQQFNNGKVIFNVWAIPRTEIRFTSSEEADLWTTLPEKKFRDALDYKGGDRLKNFLSSNG